MPAGLVNDVAEAIAFAEALGLEPVVEHRRSRTPAATASIANPIGLDGPPPRYRTPPPALGEHDGADWLPRPDIPNPNPGEGPTA